MVGAMTSPHLPSAAMATVSPEHAPTLPQLQATFVFPFSLQGSYLAHTQGKKHQTNL